MSKNQTQTAVLLIAGGIGALAIAGVSIVALVPYALLLACPLTMVFMMRGHGSGHGAGGDPSGREADDEGTGQPVARRAADVRAAHKAKR